MLEVCRLWERQALSAEMECHSTRVCLGVAVRRSPWEVYSEAQIHYSTRTASAPLVSVTLLTLWLYYCTIVACLDLGISNKWAQRQPHRQYFILTDHDRISISSYTKYLYTGRNVRPRTGYDTYVFYECFVSAVYLCRIRFLTCIVIWIGLSASDLNIWNFTPELICDTVMAMSDGTS